MQKTDKNEIQRSVDGIRPGNNAPYDMAVSSQRRRIAVFIICLFIVVAGAALFANRKAIVLYGKKIFHSLPFLNISSDGVQTAISFPDPNAGSVPSVIPIYYIPGNPDAASGANPDQNIPDGAGNPPASETQTDINIIEDLTKGSVVEEAASMGKSKSDIWWLNSGGVMLVGQEQFATNLGPLPEKSRWQAMYAKTNPTDTDGGYNPQNIFRLVTESKWKNFSQSVYFHINAFNFSKSKNRNESNGVLFFNRYQDGDNLYYAGLRIDGDAVIKKKISEKYYTLAEKKFFPSDKKYDRDTNPTLMPAQTWIGLKSEVMTDANGDVNIKLYTDMRQSGDWKLVLEVSDKGGKYGASPFADKGYAGIRTDFMDVQFKNYHIEKLQ